MIAWGTTLVSLLDFCETLILDSNWVIAHIQREVSVSERKQRAMGRQKISIQAKREEEQRPCIRPAVALTRLSPNVVQPEESKPNKGLSEIVS